MLTMTTTYSAPAPHKGKKPYKSWLKDGVSGGPCSMDILVRWLSVKANFAKWRGDESERTPKKLLLESILDTMRDHGIHHRLAKDIASKISTLQSNYRTAREWNDTEGKRLRDAGTDDETVHEELLKRFPYWDALHETFGTRTSSWPMSISSIMHRVEEEQLKLENTKHHLDDEMDELIDEDDHVKSTSPRVRNRLYSALDQQRRPRRRRRLSDSSLQTATSSTTLIQQKQQEKPDEQHRDELSSHRHHQQQPHQHQVSDNHRSTVHSHHLQQLHHRSLHQHPQQQQQQYQHRQTTVTSPTTSTSSDSSNASSSTHSLLQPMVIRPMPRSFQHSHHSNDHMKQDHQSSASTKNQPPSPSASSFSSSIPSSPPPASSLLLAYQRGQQEHQSSPPSSSFDQQQQQQHNSNHHHHQRSHHHQVLADSLLQVTREKEAGRMKRSQDMLDFLREKRLEREQLLMEKEKTRRIKAKAELVKNMVDAGFTKDEISEQLQRL